MLDIVKLLPYSLGLIALAAAAESTPPSGLPALQAYRAPAFPAELAAHSVSQGYALVAFTVDAQGHVDDAVALDASHPAFAGAVLDVLDEWQLQPAESKTVPRREIIRFAFSREGMVRTSSQMESALNMFPADAPQRPLTLSWDQLRVPPQRVAGTRPAAPAGSSGSAVISYVIDTQGRVRVPTIQTASDAAYAASALAAVKQWRYAPTQRDGVPVTVTVAQSFSYGGAKAE